MKNNRFSIFIGSIGQWLSVIIMGFGIYKYFIDCMDYGTILFCIGCLTETLATKYKYYADEYIKRNADLLAIATKQNELTIETEKSAVVDGDDFIQFF